METFCEVSLPEHLMLGGLNVGKPDIKYEIFWEASTLQSLMLEALTEGASPQESRCSRRPFMRMIRETWIELDLLLSKA